MDKCPKPMKAANVTKDLDVIRYPVYASRKIDGVRVMFWRGKAYSAAGNLFPQPVLQEVAKGVHGPECELTIRGKKLAEVSGWCNRTTEDPRDWDDLPLTLHQFGVIGQTLLGASGGIDASLYANCWHKFTYRCVIHTVIWNREVLDKHIGYALDRRDEGLMLRGGNLTYKHGKATLRCQRSLKIKFREEGTARILGVLCVIDDNGVEDRTRAGTVLVRIASGVHEGKELYVGSGFSLAQRQGMMRDQAAYVGREIEVEYLASGDEDLPRDCTFKRFVGET